MLEPVIGLVPLDDLVAGLRMDVLNEPEPPGAAVESLLQAIERHAALEAEALAQYEYLGTASDDAVIALVMRLILDDENRHHTLLRRIATTLHDALYWTESPGALPRTAAESAAPVAELATLAGSLIQEEKSGAQAYAGWPCANEA